MFIRLLALFILVPIVELVLLLQLVKYTSVMATLALVVVTGLVGTALARSQGARTFRQIALELQQGRLPTDAVLDAAAIFVAGALLLTPGLLTDLAGIVLLIPFMRRRIRAAVGRMWEAVRLSPAVRDTQPVRTLSGGNQQKVVLGKWLLAEPGVLILDEPTRGIDVGTKSEIYLLIQQLAQEGASVLVVSSELPELLGLCHRIVLLHEGRLAGEVAAETATEEQLLTYCYGRTA